LSLIFSRIFTWLSWAFWGLQDLDKTDAFSTPDSGFLRWLLSKARVMFVAQVVSVGLSTPWIL
jgi:hypothetical protein